MPKQKYFNGYDLRWFYERSDKRGFAGLPAVGMPIYEKIKHAHKIFDKLENKRVDFLNVVSCTNSMQRLARLYLQPFSPMRSKHRIDGWRELADLIYGHYYELQYETPFSSEIGQKFQRIASIQLYELGGPEFAFPTTALDKWGFEFHTNNIVILEKDLYPYCLVNRIYELNNKTYIEGYYMDLAFTKQDRPAYAILARDVALAAGEVHQAAMVARLTS